jgi:uncharacterized repeat protein (TIGR01451 family)
MMYRVPPEVAMQHLKFAFVFAAAFAMLGTAAVNAKPIVQLKLQGALVEHDPKGAEKLTPVGDVQLRPGETVRYDIVATNAGADPAVKLMPTGRIPAGTEYEAGTATISGAARIEFSIDGGKTWAVKPLVKVKTDAGIVEKPADPAMYTTLRWVNEKSLAPKQSITYTYEVRIK